MTDGLRTLCVQRRRAGVAGIRVNRPAVFNAFDEQLIGELDRLFAKLEADADVRVIVLGGTDEAREGFADFLEKRPPA